VGRINFASGDEYGHPACLILREAMPHKNGGLRVIEDEMKAACNHPQAYIAGSRSEQGRRSSIRAFVAFHVVTLAMDTTGCPRHGIPLEVHSMQQGASCRP